MLARLPLLVAAAAAACDYTLDDGTCCNAGNSEGPQTLLKAPATLTAGGDGLKADLRLDLQYRRHPNEAWQPIDKGAGRRDPWPRRARFRRARRLWQRGARARGLSGSDLILRDVPFVSGGNHRILTSFAVDANVLFPSAWMRALCTRTRPEMTRGSTPRRSPLFYYLARRRPRKTPGIYQRRRTPP